MASITTVEVIDVYSSPTNPCQNFGMDIRVVNDISDGITLFTFNLIINTTTLYEEQITYNIDDLVSVVGNLRTFEKSIDIPRPQTFPWTATVQTISGVSLYFSFLSNPITPFYPSAWSIQNLNVSIDVNGIGTVTVNTQNNFSPTAFLGLEISIDDVNYFETNTLTGLSPGNYTLYVRDIYGCKKTITFVITSEPDFEVYNDFSFISKLNPVPFTKINSKRPSIENVPSYLKNVDNAYKNLVYEYLNSEIIRFQFQSNYEINKAYLINCGEIFQELNVTKKSDNLNQRDNRDARIYFENGFLRAYFDGTGNVYDNDGNVIGQNELNGSLLFDQVQGEFIKLEDVGLLEILEVITVDGIGQVMVLNYTAPLLTQYDKLTTYFNIENYEIYEFDLTMPVIESNYQIVIVTNSTAQFDQINPLQNATFISEVINPVTEFTKDKFKFVWKNSENNQIAWDTGIECFAYFDKVLEPVFEPQDENEIYTTDTTKFMLESEVYDVFVFHFDIMSQIQTRQMMLIASSDYLLIDDEFYVKEETPEVEALTGSNTYLVKLKVTLASNYNSNEREGLTTNENVVNTDGFLRLQ